MGVSSFDVDVIGNNPWLIVYDEENDTDDEKGMLYVADDADGTVWHSAGPLNATIMV